MTEPREQLPLLTTQTDISRFDNFYLAADVAVNHEIVQMLQQLTAVGLPSPFYLHGHSGSGKTHLLSAAARRYRSVGELPLVFYDLADDRVSAAMLAAVETASFVCLDNIEAWAGEPDLEAVLFALVERAKQAQWPLLMASTWPPQRANFALADLVSRLTSGVVYHLQTMNDEAKFAAIKMRAQQRGMTVADEAIRYLLTHVARDNHSLFTLFARLDDASLAAKRRLTIPFIQQFLASENTR